jgi:hypothetical protein
LATGYVAKRGAGRLRDQGPHLEHPNYRTALTRRRAELKLVEVHVFGQSVYTDIYKTTIVAVEEASTVIVAPQEEVMNNQVPRFFTQARASFLLGIPVADLSRISKESGLGRVERAGNEEETYFTCEELQRICMLASGQLQAVQ